MYTGISEWGYSPSIYNGIVAGRGYEKFRFVLYQDSVEQLD